MIVGIFAPANLLFSYRQRKLDYALIYLIYIVIIYSIREFFPLKNILGPFDFIGSPSELTNWVIHYQYGPSFLYGFSSWIIAAYSRIGDQGWFPAIFKEEYEPSKPKMKLKDSIPINRTDYISTEKLKELKGLFDQQLISKEEYELLRKKALGL